MVYQTMDDFKVRPTSSDAPYGQGSSSTGRRKRAKRPEDPGSDEDDTVLLSGQEEPAEAVVDYYAPSQGDEEPE